MASSAPHEKQDSNIEVSQPIKDERGYVVLEGKTRLGVTVKPVTDYEGNDMGRPITSRITYLEGLRGLLGLETLLWIFFRLFAPAIVTDVDVDGVRPALFVEQSPAWMSIIRKVISPLLFDGSLQMAAFIVLMGRTSLQTFLERREPKALAGQCVRRPVRLLLPVALALALPTILSVTNGFKHANWLAERLHNKALIPPPPLKSVVVYVNSLVALFFSPLPYKTSQAAMSIPPYQVMWFVEIAFQQTYTFAIIAWTLPYLILSYKAWGTLLYIALSAWVASWSWYTITGLAICEFSIVYRQILPTNQIIQWTLEGGRKHIKLPIKVIPAAMMFLGVIFRYLWISIIPQDYDYEYVFHGSINTGKLLRDVDPNIVALPRYDNWLLVTGFLILMELSPKLQRIFLWKPLVYAGRLSFSIILISGTIMLSLGSLVYHYLVVHAGIISISALTGIMFLIFIPLCLVCSLIWAVVIDGTSLQLSHVFYSFLIN